jgi:hypothetical protein
MSLIICASGPNRTTLCSEDGAGISDANGKFTHVSDGHIKSIRLNQDCIVGFLGDGYDFTVCRIHANKGPSEFFFIQSARNRV